MGRLSAVDLLVLASLDQLLSILKYLFIFFTKQAILMRILLVQLLDLSNRAKCDQISFQ
jgi:hypothetical protein